MKITVLKTMLAATAILAIAGLGAPAMAETVAMKAALNASSEVPPNDSKATGNVTANYDTATKELTWKGTYSGLTGNATAAHFHGPAEAGKNAGVALPIANPGASFEGKATLNDAQAADLTAGRWYVNVHTAAHPAGEIRGQVTK